MAHSPSELDNELAAAVRGFLNSGAAPSVNQVRKSVEEKLGLEDAFFKQPEWAARSKAVIQKAASDPEEEDNANVASTSAAKRSAKNGVKRQSSEEPEQKPKPKRVKKDATRVKPVKKAPQKKKKVSSESELTDLDDSVDEKPKKRAKKPVSKSKKKNNDSGSELSDLDSSDEEKQPKKRVRKSMPKKKKSKQESESELGDLGSSEVEAKTKNKLAAKKLSVSESDLDVSQEDRKRKRPEPVKKQLTKRAKIEPNSENESGNEKEELVGSVPAVKDETAAVSSPEIKTKMKPEDAEEEEKLEIKPAFKDDSSELSSVEDEGPPKKKGQAKKAAEIKEEIENKAGTAVDDDSSELSSVIDEPHPKKRRKSTEAKGSSSKPKVSRSKAAPKALSGDEAEIKKLQGQLLKCGVRKIWAFELKEYGDDTRGKIRHLKKLLSDLGMSGRFSESKAKEIKERRELMADLEAVQEMNKNWGTEGRNGRASRSKAKVSLKDGSEDEDEDEESDAKDTKPRMRKRMADLAFLGSESESD